MWILNSKLKTVIVSVIILFSLVKYIENGNFQCTIVESFGNVCAGYVSDGSVNSEVRYSVRYYQYLELKNKLYLEAKDYECFEMCLERGCTLFNYNIFNTTCEIALDKNYVQNYKNVSYWFVYERE